VSTNYKTENDHAVFEQFCVSKSAIMRIEDAEIACINVTCETESVAKDHEVFDKSCAKNSDIILSEDDAIAESRGRSLKHSLAKDQAVLEIS